MSNPSHPKTIWGKVLLALFCAYLSLCLAGCASKQKPPTQDEIRQIQNRQIDADYDTVIKAAVGALQDVGFVIDNVDSRLGVITASRQTTTKLGDLLEEPELEEDADDDLPTWAKVLIIATGVIIIVGIIALIAGAGDDDDEEKSRDKGKSKDRDHDHTTTTVIETYNAGPEGVEYYQYRMTLNLESPTDSTTTIRASLHGSRMKEEAVLETGSIYNANFYSLFYERLTNALSLSPK